jgi:hypothetical protein
MNKFEQLTSLQQGLINGLISEFTKINPKPTNGTKRFSFDTINDCLKEEDRFKETIIKHNATMMKVFINQLKEDIKEFKKEFGKVVDIEMGYFNNTNTERYYTLESLIEQQTKQPLNDNNGTEIKMFFVSKTRNYGGSDSRYNYFGKNYHGIYVNFKRERVGTTLESGKNVSACKIVGLTYNTHDWLNSDKDYAKKYATLDEMVQNNKTIQQKIVELAQ